MVENHGENVKIGYDWGYPVAKIYPSQNAPHDTPLVSGGGGSFKEASFRGNFLQRKQILIEEGKHVGLSC